MASERSWVSPFNYYQNNPISRTDPNGELDGDYFRLDGTYLGSDNIDDRKVYLVSKNYEPATEEKPIVLMEGDYKEVNVTIDELLQSAASANNEWEKSFEGRAAIVHAIINRKNAMNFSFDVAMGSLAGNSVGASHASRMKSIWFAGYAAFINAGAYGRNKNAVYKSCIAAALDAYNGGTDYSNGAIGWQGEDLTDASKLADGTYKRLAYRMYIKNGFMWNDEVANKNGTYPLPNITRVGYATKSNYYVGLAYYGRNIFLNH